jgi:hypothetical protein
VNGTFVNNPSRFQYFIDPAWFEFLANLEKFAFLAVFNFSTM